MDRDMTGPSPTRRHPFPSRWLPLNSLDAGWYQNYWSRPSSPWPEWRPIEVAWGEDSLYGNMSKSSSYNKGYAPRPIVFLQLAHPQQSSNVSQRPPGNISEVDGACPFSPSQFRSTPSPSVLPPPLKKLNENALWHASTWLCRWNLGTSERMVIKGRESPRATGRCWTRSQNFLNHWQPTS